MSKNKTTSTSASVIDFVEALENDQKKSDSYKLIELMSAVSGNKAAMWGPSIIGSYHYKQVSLVVIITNMRVVTKVMLQFWDFHLENQPCLFTFSQVLKSINTC